MGTPPSSTGPPVGPPPGPRTPARRRNPRSFIALGSAGLLGLGLVCAVSLAVIGAQGGGRDATPPAAPPAAAQSAPPAPPLSSAAPTSTAAVRLPAATVAPATATAPATPPQFRSGGFARTRAEWERTNGQPERNTAGLLTYSGGRYLVIYSGDRVAHLERIWDAGDAKSLDFATGALNPLLPSDARLVRSYRSPRSGSPVDLYQSPALAALFPSDAFIGGQPGEFIVSYRMRSDGEVTSFVMRLGNNP